MHSGKPTKSQVHEACSSAQSPALLQCGLVGASADVPSAKASESASSRSHRHASLRRQRRVRDTPNVVSLYCEIEGWLCTETLAKAIESLSVALSLPAQTGVEKRMATACLTRLRVRSIETAPAPRAAALEWMRCEALNAAPSDREAPLVCHLLRLGIERYFLYLRGDAGFTDESGLACIARQLCQHYQALRQGLQSTPAATNAVQDCLGAARLTPQRVARNRAFWAMRLAQDADHACLARRAPKSHIVARTRHTLTLEGEFVQRLRALAQAEAVALPHLLLAACAAHFSFLCDHPGLRFAVALPALRRRNDRDLTAGASVSPLSLTVNAARPARELLQRARTSLTEVLRHRRGCDEQILEDALCSASRFCPTLGWLRSTPEQHIEGCRTQWHIGHLPHGTGMRLFCHEDVGASRLEVVIEDTLDAHSSAQLAAHGRRLRSWLGALCHGVDRSLDEIRFLCDDEGDAALDESLYALRYRPIAGGFLCWHRDAELLARFALALDLPGHTVNPLCRLKLLLPDRRQLFVGHAKADGPCPGAAPGTVLSVDAHGWRVATRHGAVRLSGLSQIDGRPLGPVRGAAWAGITCGSRLPDLTPALAQRLGRAWCAAAQHEAFWRKRIARLNPLRLHVNSTRAAESRWRATEWRLPPMLAPLRAPSRILHLLAAWCLELSHHAATQPFHLAYHDAARPDAPSVMLFADVLPLEICFDPAWHFSDVVQRLGEECQQLRCRLPFTSDLPLRCPAPGQSSPHQWQAGVALGQSAAASIEADGTALQARFGEHIVLVLQFASDDGRYRWLIDTAHLDESRIARFDASLHAILAAARDPRQARLPVARLSHRVPDDSAALLERITL